MISQLKQVHVDVGCQEVLARQLGDPGITNMEQKLFPTLTSLHAACFFFFPPFYNNSYLCR